MDEVQRAYRNLKTNVKKTARSVDGTDLSDRAGNAGDSARESLGNVGDHVRKAGREPQKARGDRAKMPERPM